MWVKNLKNHKIQIFAKLRFNAVFLLVFFFSTFIFLIPFLLKGKAADNSYIGNSYLGGMRYSESEEVINKILDKYGSSEATLVLNDQIVEAKIYDLGFEFDTNSISDQLYFFGDGNDYLSDLKQFYASFVKRREIKPIFSLNISKFNEFIDKKFSGIEKQPQSAKFAINAGRAVVVNSEDGEIINRTKIIFDLSEKVESLSLSPIEIEKISVFPEINSSELNLIAERYQNLLNRRIFLSWNYDSWKLAGEDLLQMLKIDHSGNLDGFLLTLDFGTNKTSLKNLSFDGSSSPGVEILVDNGKLDIFLHSIAKAVNRPAVNATAIFDGSKITSFAPAIDGQKLNVDEVKSLIFSQISVNNTGKNTDINIKLSIAVTTARIANDQINALGIHELIGKGISYFAGSIANRIFNIELGAGRINGTLIAPGDVFSFNNTVGEVSGKTGYKQAYVISSGRTVLDDGGGICQVSTTVFRAVLNSGLPIVSRTAHAYRVGYYEQKGFGPGLDATVFAPSVDFKFKNDTGRHILIQTVFNRANAMLEVDIYGTRDVRTVELSKPVVLNRTPAPPEIKQDDPSLPKGTVKQVDFAAEGANVYFTRKVYREGQLLYDDTIKSNFKPWQAIFLVGTGG